MSVTPRPKWYMPTAVTALVWNLLGCVSVLLVVLGWKATEQGWIQ